NEPAPPAVEAAAADRQVHPAKVCGEVDSAGDRLATEEDVPGPARQLPRRGTGPGPVDRPGDEPRVAPEDGLLRRRRGGTLAGRDFEHAADFRENEHRTGPGGLHPHAPLAPPVSLAGPRPPNATNSP